MSSTVNFSNFKLSIYLNAITLKKLEELFLNKDIFYEKYSNYICFIIYRKRKRSRKNPLKKDYFSYSIWKKAECLKNCGSIANQSDTIHCNITKVGEKGEINKAIRKLQKLLEIPVIKTKYQIDNITATIKVGHKINLKKFEQQNRYIEDIDYNPETFPGLKITKNNLTYVLFTSGSINIVGGKSKKQIWEGIPWIKSKIPRLKIKKDYRIKYEE